MHPVQGRAEVSGGLQPVHLWNLVPLTFAQHINHLLCFLGEMHNKYTVLHIYYISYNTHWMVTVTQTSRVSRWNAHKCGLTHREMNAEHTFRVLGMVTGGCLMFSSGSLFLDLEIMRGLMLRKMVMMRMLIGNMRRPLSIPTMISCQVISSEPVKEKKGKVGGVSDEKQPKTRPSHDHGVTENSAYWFYGSPQLVW